VADHQFRITWSKHGERSSEQPETVSADYFADERDFIEFGIWVDGFQQTVLRIRASDVQEIRQMD
jgi:hypothetical protein